MSQNGVLVGCDKTLECFLPWWWTHYSSHNDLPVAFADFGMSPPARNWCQKRGQLISIPQTELPPDHTIPHQTQALWSAHYGTGIYQIRAAWFTKPYALLHSPFKAGLWIDIDCQVNGSLESLFPLLEFAGEIGLVQEPAHIQALLKEQGVLLPDEIYYNSGVILFRKEAQILHAWIAEGKENSIRYPTDQHALSRAIYKHRPAVIDLPSSYNWICADDPKRMAVIRHYCGQLKLEILKNAYPEKMHHMHLFKHLYDFTYSLNMEAEQKTT